MGKGHSILKVTEKLFWARSRHVAFWPKMTTFEKLKERDNLVTVIQVDEDIMPIMACLAKVITRFFFL